MGTPGLTPTQPLGVEGSPPCPAPQGSAPPLPAILHHLTSCVVLWFDLHWHVVPRRRMGTPLRLGGTAQWQQSLLSPRSPNTPVQINLLPATPCLGFLGCQPLPGAERSRGGPGVVWWGGLIPSPHRFCAAPCHCHPCNISGFGELVWGGGGSGKGVSCPFWGTLSLFGRSAQCKAQWSLWCCPGHGGSQSPREGGFRAPLASLPKGKPSPRLAGQRGRRGNKRFVPEPDESVASRGSLRWLGRAQVHSQLTVPSLQAEPGLNLWQTTEKSPTQAALRGHEAMLVSAGPAGTPDREIQHQV